MRADAEREAALLLGAGAPEAAGHEGAPAWARALRRQGARAVAVTGGDGPDVEGRVLDWIDTPQAVGWLAGPRIDTPHRHGMALVSVGQTGPQAR